MSIRTFWLIFLKVIGIFLLYSSLSVIPSLAAVPMMLGMGAQLEETIVPLIIILVSAAVYGLLVYLFLFRSGYILKLLKLEDDFDEDSIELEVQPVTILTFAAILIGGIMVVTGLPTLVKEIIACISTSHLYGAQPSLGWTLYYLTQCVLGFLLIFKNKWVVDFIENRANDSIADEHQDDILDSEDQ